MAGYSNGVHKEMEGHWNKLAGTYFEKKKLCSTTDSPTRIIKQAKTVDQNLGIQFVNEVPDIGAGDTWLEVLNVCRASFAISSIVVTPLAISYG
jgi:hypothetical protein